MINMQANLKIVKRELLITWVQAPSLAEAGTSSSMA
jgi:hypothetical protein